MPPTKQTYHHGDLRAALVRAALELLEESGESELSLRATARRAGVSPSAPYRHYADREALVSAVAAVGYMELLQRLAAVHPAPGTPQEIGDIAVEYVHFALDRPALFRAMFGESCDDDNAERVAAVAAISQYVLAIAQRLSVDSDVDALATALWAMVHGLAFLHLDGKLDARPRAAVDVRVRAAAHALLGVSAATMPH
jgi:AcrR family transcriptional regulator